MVYGFLDHGIAVAADHRIGTIRFQRFCRDDVFDVIHDNIVFQFYPTTVLAGIDAAVFRIAHSQLGAGCQAQGTGPLRGVCSGNSCQLTVVSHDIQLIATLLT